jgi:hypothetical protein
MKNFLNGLKEHKFKVVAALVVVAIIAVMIAGGVDVSSVGFND